MSKKRNRYTPEFKAKVALAALKNEETISELAARFGVHPTMINSWKRALLDGAAEVFDKGNKVRKHNESQIEDLYRQIGRLKVENVFFPKSTISKARAAEADSRYR